MTSFSVDSGSSWSRKVPIAGFAVTAIWAILACTVRLFANGASWFYAVGLALLMTLGIVMWVVGTALVAYSLLDKHKDSV